jgi:hypothetical protein
VEDYLTELLLVFHDITENEARSRAKKIDTDGKGLYGLSEADWRAKYDIQGSMIYYELQDSRYGRVRYISLSC